MTITLGIFIGLFGLAVIVAVKRKVSQRELKARTSNEPRLWSI
jgi:hypothetical protein